MGWGVGVWSGDVVCRGYCGGARFCFWVGVFVVVECVKGVGCGLGWLRGFSGWLIDMGLGVVDLWEGGLVFSCGVCGSVRVIGRGGGGGLAGGGGGTLVHGTRVRLGPETERGSDLRWSRRKDVTFGPVVRNMCKSWELCLLMWKKGLEVGVYNYKHVRSRGSLSRGNC